MWKNKEYLNITKNYTNFKTKRIAMNTTRKSENETKKKIVLKPTSAKKFALNYMRNK
jgi:peptidyl-tRNA hydrolase